MYENNYLPNIKELRKIENDYNIKLPDDYIEFMMFKNGSVDINEVKEFRANGINEDLVIEELSFFPDDINNMNRIFINEHEGKFFYIGDCGGVSLFEIIFNKETGYIEAWDRQGTYCEEEEMMEECLDTYKIANNFSDFARMSFGDEDYEEFLSLFEDREYPSDFIEDSQKTFEFLQTESIIDRENYVWYYDVPSGNMQMVEKEVFRSFMSLLSMELSDLQITKPIMSKSINEGNLSTKKKKMFSKESYDKQSNTLKQKYNLPKIYLDYLETFNGSLLMNSDKSGYYVEKLNSYIYISLLFGVFTENKVNDLLEMNESNKDIKEDRFFIIGEDLSNGLILVDLENSNNPVYYWDIANFHRGSSYLGNTYIISDSLSNFLGNIENEY